MWLHSRHRHWVTGLREVWARPTGGASLGPSLMALGGCIYAEQPRPLDEFFSVLGLGTFVYFERGQTMDRSSTSRTEKMLRETPGPSCFPWVAMAVPVASLSETPQ